MEDITRIRAQKLRKNATKEENHLWYDFLRTYPVQFLRQKPFGPYIVDFYCYKARLPLNWMVPSIMREMVQNWTPPERLTCKKWKKSRFCVLQILRSNRILRVCVPSLTGR